MTALLNNFPRYPAAWDIAQLTTDQPTTTVEALTPIVMHEGGPSTSLGKRSRRRYGTPTMIGLLADDKNSDEDRSSGPNPNKRVRSNGAGVLGGAKSTKRTRRPPVTRTQANFKNASKTTRRGAERLVSTTARGVHHRSLLGLSVPQGSVSLLVQEQPSLIEEREQVETGRDMGSSAQQQIVLQDNAEHGEDLRKIPGKLTKRHRSMLLTTQAERERGGVRAIKCKLCPDAQFGSWATFRRHCKDCETHPLELHYCDLCGDYFARLDSRNRHQITKEEACRKTSHDDAKQKKEKVGRLFKAFGARLTHCLESGEGIWPTFSEAASRTLADTCDNTSKQVPNQEEISFEGTWAAGLCQ